MHAARAEGEPAEASGLPGRKINATPLLPKGRRREGAGRPRREPRKADRSFNREGGGARADAA